MLSVLLAIVPSSLLVAVLGAAGASLTRRWWRGLPVLAWCYAVIAVGALGWLQFVITWLSPAAGRWFSVALAVVAAGTFAARRMWRGLPRHADVLTIALGVVVLYVGLLYLWETPLDPFSLAALRFSYHATPYPVDNVIPYLMANRIGDGQSTHALILDFNGSDRPPLQSGTILTAQNVLAGLKLDGSALPFAVGVVMQLLWIPALWALLSVAGIQRRVVALSICFAAATATLLLNTTYTWPKLLSAALIIVALALLLAVRRGLVPAPPAVTGALLATALAMLSHGAAAFAAPAVIVLLVLALRRARRPWAVLGVSVGAAALTYLPWLLYQRLADPPGDRLLKWHLAGVIPLDARPFLPTLIHSYTSTPLSRILDARLTNLGIIFSPNVAEPSLSAHRYAEYYDTSAALSLSLVSLVAILIWVITLRARRSPVPDRPVLWLMLLMLPCILFWWILLFLPGGAVVHQGSHVWLVVLIGASFAWIAQRRLWLGFVVLGLQVAITAWYYVPFIGTTVLHPAGVVVAVAGVAVMAVGCLLAGRAQRRWTTSPAAIA